MVLTEVFFPFKDDIAILTKFTPSQSKGIVLTSPPPFCVSSVPLCLLGASWKSDLRFCEASVRRTSQAFCSVICESVLGYLGSNLGEELTGYFPPGAPCSSGLWLLLSILRGSDVHFLYCSCSGTCLCVFPGVNVVSMLYFSVHTCFAFSFCLRVSCSRVIQFYSPESEMSRGFPSTVCMSNQLWCWESI